MNEAAVAGLVVPVLTLADAFAAAVLVYNTILYRRELSWLRLLKAHFAAHSTGAATFLDTLPARTDIPATCVCRKRVNILRQLTLHHVPVDVGTLSELASAHEEPIWRNTLPNFIVSSLLIAGLGGTFLALKNMLSDSPLQRVAQGGGANGGQLDTEAIRLTIERIYSGFGGAFNTSIAGIAFTLGLLAVRVLVLTPARERFFSELDDFTQVSLLPLFQGRQFSPEAQLMAVGEKLNQVADNLLAVSERLGGGATTAERAVADLAGFTAELTKFSRALGDSLGEDSPMQRILERLRDLLRDADQRHKELCVRFDDALQEGRRENDNLVRTREAVTSAVHAARGIAEDLAGEAGRTRTAFESALKEFAAGVQTEYTMRTTGFHDLQRQAQTLLEVLQARQEHVEAETRGVLGALSSGVSAVGPTLTSILEGINEIRSRSTIPPADPWPERLEGWRQAHAADLERTLGLNGHSTGAATPAVNLREVLDARFGELSALTGRSVEVLEGLRAAVEQRPATEPPGEGPHSGSERPRSQPLVEPPAREPRSLFSRFGRGGS